MSAGWAPPALAQSPDWGWYDAPRWRPQYRRPWYDDAYGGWYAPRRDDGGRRYYRAIEPDQGRGQDDPRYGGRYEPRGRDDGVDDGRDQQNLITADGGGQPTIAPQAPPVVPFAASYPVNSIVIDTGARRLYFIRDERSAYAYPIGVGREGFSWTGNEKVSRIADWPDWYPPADMRERKPELPEKMTGGIRNPLGAKAIYLGNTLYRIHGTNDPKSIGKAESSGCFRMLNANVLHLASLVEIGTPVAVVRSLGRAPVIASAPPPRLYQPAPSERPPPRRYPRPRVEWTPDPDPRHYDPDEWDDGR